MFALEIVATAKHKGKKLRRQKSGRFLDLNALVSAPKPVLMLYLWTA
jgi:hypothetical protein